MKLCRKHNVSLSRIESRPAPTDASAIKFYVDFNAHPTDSNVVALLKDLKESVAAHVQLTGSKEGKITFMVVFLVLYREITIN